MNIEQIGAILAFILSISGNVFQFLKERRKQNLDSIGLLIDGAIKLNKQEIETIRELNAYLVNQVKEQKQEITELEKKAELKDSEIIQLRNELSLLRSRLDKCQSDITKLTLAGDTNG